VKRIVVLMAFAALAAAVVPGQASAQFGGQGSDFCADKSPWKNPPAGFDSTKGLTLGISGGSGTVAPSMYNTPADPSGCITPFTQCSAATCAYQIKTVCAFHCYSHLHMDPQHWDVRLAPTPSGGAFLGWGGSDVCRPPSSASVSRSDCLVLMDRERSVVAMFGPQPDGVPPTAPAVTATADRYALNISWTASNDEYLAGYEVWVGSKMAVRLAKNQTTYRAANLSCATPYNVRVVAFDTVHEAVGQSTIATGACPPAAQRPRPNTALHVKPPKRTKARTAFFHFGTRGEVAATKYQCKLDKRRWARCSGLNGKRYRSLKKGYHTFRVRAGNAVGWDATPATWRWRIR
jgi:hypothetical protein